MRPWTHWTGLPSGPVNELKSIWLGRTNRTIWTRPTVGAGEISGVTDFAGIDFIQDSAGTRRGRYIGMLRAGGMVALLTSALGVHGQEHSSSNRFFLPQNPVAAAYVLGRLSSQELIAAPRSEYVYVALLQRKGLERKYRVEALEGLSRIRKTDPLTELVRSLAELDKRGVEATETIQELGQVLMRFRPQELLAKRSALEKLVRESALPLTRQIGLAAMMTAEQSFEAVWNRAATNSSQFVDLLLSVPLVMPAQLRSGLYGRTEELVRTSNSSEVKRAAMSALVAMPGHEVESFKTLAGIVQSRPEQEAAIASLQQISKNTWPKELIAPLETNLVAYLQAIPSSDRTGVRFSNALELATEAATLLPDESARSLRRALRGLGPAVFVLHAVYEQMRFDKQLLVVEAGKPVAIRLQNDDAMPHNLAILTPGALEEIGSTAEKMPAEPDAQGRLYVPASPKVLYATKLVLPGQTVQLAFTAPAEPGEYSFVCTFPGHWRRMVGTLAVVQDVEAYLATHAAALRPTITEWKLADLQPVLAQMSDRDLAEGAELFTKLACAQCHKLGESGYSYGPSLTDVFIRYKNDRASVLQQILEPSKIIEDRYRNFSFELKDSEPVLGMVLKEDAETITVQTGPADSLIQVLKKSDILKRSPQASSPMPLGLLNALSKDQILDLLAYLETGGNLPRHHHSQ
jgi:putative heme-binding domain-containing protein